jgi:hypothetical protein
MRSKTTIALSALLLFVVGACDGGEEEKPAFKPTKSLSELSQAKMDVSEEELAAARKNSGFKSQDEIAKENAAMFEKGAREYVKTRMPEYRDIVAELRKHTDDIEAQAAKWPEAKDPDKAFEKFSSGYSERAKSLTDTYDTLTARGAEGGNVQVDLGAAFRTWEDLKNALGPNTGKDERFATTLKTIRDSLDKVNASLDDIDKDESLKVDENYEAPTKGKKGKKGKKSK